MRCPACNRRVPDDAEVCGHCGRKLREDEAKKTMMGIPAMGRDEEEQDDSGESESPRSTLFGIPAANREDDEDEPPMGPGGQQVKDDATPIPQNYQGDGEARTQVADKDTLTDAIRDSGAHQSPRSTMFGTPSADDEAEQDDDIASKWELGEDSEEAEGETMVASGNLLDKAVESDAQGEGSGYSKPRADVDPNVQTLMGMQSAESEERAEESDAYEDYDDSTQAMSAEELDEFEQRIKEQDGFEAPGGSAPAGGSEEPGGSPPTQSMGDDSPPAASSDSDKRRSLLEKLKRRSGEADEGEDPRKTAAGIPAAHEDEDASDTGVGLDTIDDRGSGSGPRFSIPTPGDAKPSAPGTPSESGSDEDDDDATQVAGDTPRSGVLQARKRPKQSEQNDGRGVLESSSSYRISGGSSPELKGREDADAGTQESEPQTSFPISDSTSSGAAEQASSEKTAVLGDDDIAELSLDDTAALDDQAVPPTQEISDEHIVPDSDLAETGIADPDQMPGEFDSTGGAAPEQFAQGSSDSRTSGVVQPGEHGSGVEPPPRSSGVSQPGQGSGVIQPDEGGSGVAQPEQPPGIPGSSERDSGVVQPDAHREARDSGVVQPDASREARDSGVVQPEPSDNGTEPPASSTQLGGFAPEAGGGTQPDEQPQPTPSPEDSGFDFGATPAGASSTQEAPNARSSQQGGFGADSVPNPSQPLSTESASQRQTQPPAGEQDEANKLERTIRVVFAALGGLVTMGAGVAAYLQGVLELPVVEMGIFLSPLAIGLLTLGVGVLPLSSGVKSVGLVLMTLLAGGALAGAILLGAAPVVMLILVGGTLLTLCAAAFPALVSLVK